MKLYQAALSPFAARVRIQIYHKGLDVELVDPPGMGTDAYLKVNPIGKVPALDVDGFVLAESEVICEYLEDVFPKKPMRPEDPLDRARGRVLSRITDLYLFGALGGLFGQMDPSTRDQAVVNEGLEAMRKGLGYLEHYLGDTRFAAADSLTLADCSMAPVLFFITALAPALGVKKPYDGFPKLAAYWDAVSAEASCAKAIGEMEKALKAMQGG